MGSHNIGGINMGGGYLLFCEVASTHLYASVGYS